MFTSWKFVQLSRHLAQSLLCSHGIGWGTLEQVATHWPLLLFRQWKEGCNLSKKASERVNRVQIQSQKWCLHLSPLRPIVCTLLIFFPYVSRWPNIGLMFGQAQFNGSSNTKQWTSVVSMLGHRRNIEATGVYRFVFTKGCSTFVETHTHTRQFSCMAKSTKISFLLWEETPQKQTRRNKNVFSII